MEPGTFSGAPGMTPGMTHSSSPEQIGSASGGDALSAPDAAPSRKAPWMAFIGLPLRAAGRLDPASAQTFLEVGVGVVLVPIVMPWGHVWENYVRRVGDRWR